MWTLVVLTPTPSAAQRVRERFGNIEYVDAQGLTRSITRGGGFGEPTLSPNGRVVAYLQRGDGASTTLWVADGSSAISRIVSVTSIAVNGEDGAEYSRPIFSLDGGFVYATESAAAPGSASVQQIRLRDGFRRFVTGGRLLSVLRTGPHRGYLLVEKHRYYPQGGSYNPVSVVRPDGREMFVVPGSEVDDGARAVGPWLRRNGWTAH